MNAYTPLSAEVSRQLRAAQYKREIEAAEELRSRLDDFIASCRFRQSSDFDELRVCNAIIDLFDDGDVVGRRDAILEENRWDEDGDPLPGDGDYSFAGTVRVVMAERGE